MFIDEADAVIADGSLFFDKNTIGGMACLQNTPIVICQSATWDELSKLHSDAVFGTLVNSEVYPHQVDVSDPDRSTKSDLLHSFHSNN